MTNIKVKEHKTVSTAQRRLPHPDPERLGAVRAHGALPAEETDKIELMTYGSFLKKAGSYYISYKETETIGFAGCTTTIKIAEDGSRVALLRFGKVNTQLVIQRDYRNICYYETGGRPHYAGRDRRRHRVRPRSLRAARQSSAICWMPMTHSAHQSDNA